jgi:acetoin utilization deacetylase AcuC-like enzyme
VPSSPIQIVQDPRFQDHRAPRPHPECPERLLAVSQAIREFEARSGTPFEARAPRPATPDEILQIHSASLLGEVKAASERAPTKLDADTYVAPSSFETALLAAGSTVDLALAIARGDTRCGLAAVRPPGHHAEATHAMGFCLFNNAAIAARALQTQAQLGKILIIDWDVHHGNGTQHSFAEDPSILYVSTHQFPHYPGTGSAGEAGSGRGLGATLNIPMPAGCGNTEYVGAFTRLLVPATREFRPELIVISCGFDAHADDPLASMQLDREGYLAMTRIVRALADEVCNGRVLVVLEGGYAESGLRDGTNAVLEGLMESPTPELPQTPEILPGSALRAIVDQVIDVHRRHYPTLGSP